MKTRIIAQASWFRVKRSIPEIGDPMVGSLIELRVVPGNRAWFRDLLLTGRLELALPPSPEELRDGAFAEIHRQGD